MLMTSSDVPREKVSIDFNSLIFYIEIIEYLRIDYTNISLNVVIL